GTPATPGQTFCDGCGAVLHWTPSARGPEPAPEAEPEPAPAPAPTPDAAPPAEAPATPDPTPEPEPRPESSDHEKPTEPLPTTEPAPAPAAATPPDNARARALLVPVADPNQRANEPVAGPVLPGRPLTARPTVQGPGAEPGDAGGAPCPWCGTGNRPD